MANYNSIVNKQHFYSLILIIGIIYGCASIQSPQGGPKDTAPPKSVKMEPQNMTTNFSAKKIVLTFDENIRLENEFKEFSISPEMEKPPILKAKQRTLEITLQDSLEKNTTYTLNFGKAIADINEGNAIKNFTYVFSTGPTVDSLSISGNVKNIKTGAGQLDVVVFILPLTRDSIFGKKKPSIYTRTDSSGNFKLNNLRKDTYKIYALKEQNGDKIYQQPNDEIGFIKEPIVLTKVVEGIKINIFKELASTFRIVDRKLNTDGSISMNFNQHLKRPEISVIYPVTVDIGKIVRFNKGNDSVKLWLKELNFDSIKVVVKDEGKVLDTVKFTRVKKDVYTRNILAGDNLEGNSLNPYHDLKLLFNFPTGNIDLSKISLLEDSIPRKGFTITKDSLDILAYHFKYPWKNKEKYILKIGENALTGFLEAKNKEITKTFEVGVAENYGNLTLRVEVPDTTKNYILEFVNERKEIVVASYRIYKNTTINFSNFKTGIYYARIIYDDNKNGIWDTGNVKKGIQPEKIIYEPKEMSIKANWKREEVISIPKE